MLGSNGNNDARDEQNGPVPQAPVAVVLAGAGARGAYEAGFIATLLPRLRPRPTIFVGTSAGAINAALLAATAHLPPTDAANAIMASWRKLRKERVFGSLWRSVPSALAKYAQALVLGEEPPQSLADTSPLTAALTDPQLLDWQKVRENISSGLLDALAVAATETGSGRTKLFYQTRHGFDHGLAQASGETQAIDYVDTQLGADHVRASAAIPVLFPPVMISAETGAKSFFIDGGIRLNAPLKPALKLGAKGIVVVSTDPRHFGTSLAVELRSPTMQGQVLQVLRALFADRMIEDIHVLLNRNRKRAEQLRHGAAANDTKRGSRDRIVPIIFGGPVDHDRLGGIAARAIDELLRGAPFVRLFKNIDVTLLNWLTSVSATSGPDLMSYILFEPQFIELALKAGIQDASALLNDYPEPKDLWQALAERDSRQRAPEQGAPTAPLSQQPAAA